MNYPDFSDKQEGRDTMDLFGAIKGRRSCRAFLPDPIAEEAVMKILEAATWAPSPLNAQPWDTNQGLKEKIFLEGQRCKVQFIS